MSLKALKFALVGCMVLVAASTLVAAPMVTMQQNIVTSGVNTYTALDFFYSSTPGAEFLNYRLDVQNSNGALLADPNKPQTFDPGTDVVDTVMNTVGSFLGAGSPSFVHNSYQPTGFSASPQPTARIDWSVFDTLTGDTNNIDGFPPAPYHLARVLVLPTGTGTADFLAFDSATPGVGTNFHFEYGVIANVPPQVVDYIEPMPIHASIPGTYSHQMDVIDPDDTEHTWTGPTLLSFTPGFGGTGGTGPFTAATLTSGGLFEWMTVGSDRGTYVWSVNASDGTGNDDGTITLNVTAVPEPGTFALLGLAIVGLIGYARRR